MKSIKRKIIALFCGASVLCSLVLTTGAILENNNVSDESAECKIRNASIFDALEILKHLIEMDSNAVQLMGKEDLSIFDALEILKGLVGMTDCVKIQIPAAVWKEVPVLDVKDRKVAQTSKAPFDLRGIITGKSERFFNHTFNTYSFSGTIVGLKEFMQEWTDDSGYHWGPFPASIIEVKVNKEYNGKTSAEGDIVRLYYPLSVSVSHGDSIHIVEGAEYVFIGCWIIDETYSAFNEKYNPVVVNNGVEKYADFVMGDVFLVEKGNVISYFEYFSHNENAMKKVIDPNLVKTDMLTYPNSLEFGRYIAMSIADFEEEFMKLFENPGILPTLERQLTE